MIEVGVAALKVRVKTMNVEFDFKFLAFDEAMIRDILNVIFRKPDFLFPITVLATFTT